MTTTDAVPGRGGVPSARRTAVARRRSLLPVVATRHIIERGFDGVSVNDLARDLGISVGGLYRYIRTKSDLLVMACETIYGELGATLAGVVADDDRPAADRLIEAMAVLLRECRRTRDQILLMYREYRHLPDDAHRRYRDREREILDLFAGLVSAGIERGEFQPVNPVVIAQDIVLLAHLPALKGWSVGGLVEPEALDREQIGLVLGRLRPERDGAHRSAGGPPSDRGSGPADHP